MSDKNESELIQDIITKSEDDFEKKILYIAAGALLLSMTLIEKIIKLEFSVDMGLLIAGWVCLILTLLINLVSHLISKTILRNIQEEIDEKVEFELRRCRHKKRILTIELVNWCSFGTLVIGIFMIVIFAWINISHPYKTPNQTNQKEDTIKIESIN